MKIKKLNIFGNETLLELEENETINNINFVPFVPYDGVERINCEIFIKNNETIYKIVFFLKEEPLTLEKLFNENRIEVIL